MTANKIYFPNLNGLRFIAAFVVLLHHMEQSRFFMGFDNYWHNKSVVIVGKLGVLLFFVLSGYLITYLLLAEREKTGTIPHVHEEVYAVLFGVIILNFSANPKPYFSLENPVFNYLGKISYGLYMYHVIGITVALKSLDMLGIRNAFLQISLAVLLTVAIAAFSYWLMESRFIRLKTKYSKIISGDNVYDKTEQDYVASGVTDRNILLENKKNEG